MFFDSIKEFMQFFLFMAGLFVCVFVVTIPIAGSLVAIDCAVYEAGTGHKTEMRFISCFVEDSETGERYELSEFKERAVAERGLRGG